MGKKKLELKDFSGPPYSRKQNNALEMETLGTTI